MSVRIKEMIPKPGCIYCIHCGEINNTRCGILREYIDPCFVKELEKKHSHTTWDIARADADYSVRTTYSERNKNGTRTILDVSYIKPPDLLSIRAMPPIVYDPKSE